MSPGELASLIILVCGVNSKNVDDDKIKECIDKVNNCMVIQDGNIKRERIQECLAHK